MRRTLPLLAAALLAVLVAPAAAAQVGDGIDLRLTLPTVPIKPQVENPAFAAEVTVPCDAVLARLSPSDPQEEIPVLVTFVTQEGVVVTGPATLPVDPAECVAGTAATVEAYGAFQLSIARTVPGLLESPAVATARLGDAPGSQPLESSVPFTVTPDAYIVAQLMVDRKLDRCEDGRARFQATVTNLGNVRTRYTFEVADAPGGGWRLAAPEELVLDSPLREGGLSEATVDLVVDCPFGNGEGSFELVARPAAADDPAKEGNPLTAKLLARSRAVPPPTPALLLAGLAAAALLARRRA